MKTIEFKLYPASPQEQTLTEWLHTACWVYNQAIEQRIKTYRRRKESVTYYDQCKTLTVWRSRILSISSLPIVFAKDALRRVDRGFKAFFRRVKTGENPGFPRFHSTMRYSSLEAVATGRYIRPDCFVHIPKLGLVRFRAGNQRIPAKQKLFRVIRRASGWYGQVLVDTERPKQVVTEPKTSVGIDLGLSSFATLSDGRKIGNPRHYQLSEKRLRIIQRHLSRCRKGGRNRRKARQRVARFCERIQSQRRSFCHQESRKLVDKFDLIAYENLNIKGMAGGNFAKSIQDAAWGTFINMLSYKAEWAGKLAVGVDPRGTSQTCPNCGAVKPKNLSERTHRCPCGLVIDRDVAAAQVILARAVAGRRGVTPSEGAASTSNIDLEQVILMTKVGPT